MQWLRNLAVSSKFIFAFGVVCCLCIVLGVYTCLTFRAIASKSQDVTSNVVPSFVALTDIRGEANSIRRQDLALLLCTAPSCLASHQSVRQTAISKYQAALKAYAPLITYPGEQELYQKFSSGFAQYLENSDRGSALIAAGKVGNALDIVGSDATDANFSAVVATMNEDLNLNAKYGTEESATVTSSASNSVWINIGTTLLIVLLCALIGVLLTREIAPRVARIKNSVEAMANKDLTANIRITGTDEIGQLGEALNFSITSIRSVLQSVAHGAETLSAATTPISARCPERGQLADRVQQG